MEKIFQTKISVVSIILMTSCIGINFLGKFIATLIDLPLWLDCVGTCLCGCLGGPILGAVCGAISNLVYGFLTDTTIVVVYSITGVGIGLAVGIMSRLQYMDSFLNALLTALITGLVAIIISTPLNILFGDGTTGNIWGDAVFHNAMLVNVPILVSSFLDELIVDIPDKVISVMLVFAFLQKIPSNLAQYFDFRAE